MDRKSCKAIICCYTLIHMHKCVVVSMAVYCGQYYQNIFSWAKYKIFMGKHKFQWPKTARLRSQHVFSLSKHVILWQTYFHGQSATFSSAKHQSFMDKPNCMNPPRWRCSELLTTPEVGGARKKLSSIH